MRNRVVVVQHGEKVREPGDPGLTELGRRQALATARFVADHFAPSAVWASTLRRAVETATPLADAVGCDLLVDPRFRERMNWEGDQERSLEKFLSEWSRASEERSFIPSYGDSSNQAAARFIEALTEIVGCGEPGDTAAVVAHGGVTVDALRSIAGDGHVRDLRPELISDGVPCGAVTVLEYADDTWSVVHLPSVDHLEETTDHRPA